MVLWVLLLCLVPPSIAKVGINQEVIFAQQGGSVTLPRMKWRDPGKVYVNWYFVTERAMLLISRNPQQPTPKKDNWPDRISLSPDFSLIISPVQDFGVFRCEQHELMDTDNKEYRIYQIMMPSSITLVASDDFSVSCDLEEEGYNSAHPRVECFMPDGQKKSSLTTNRNRNTLTSKGVSSKDSGLWWCSVLYRVLSKSHISNASTTLTVIDLAPSSPDPIYTSVSSDCSVPCALSSSIPWSTLNSTGLQGGSWSFTPLNSQNTLTLLTLGVNPTPQWKGQEGTDPFIKGTELHNNDLSVKIPKVSVDHRGSYNCSLKIKSKVLRSNVTVEVLQVISSATGNVQEGAMVNLTCCLGHSLSPDLELTWTKPRASPPIQTNHQSLLLSPVKLQHSGSWTCSLKKKGTLLTSANVTLKIVKAPVDIWLVVSITCGVLVFILFLATTIIVCRHRQAMNRRRRRTKFCCCEKPHPKGFYKT